MVPPREQERQACRQAWRPRCTPQRLLQLPLTRLRTRRNPLHYSIRIVAACPCPSCSSSTSSLLSPPPPQRSASSTTILPPPLCCLSRRYLALPPPPSFSCQRLCSPPPAPRLRRYSSKQRARSASRQPHCHPPIQFLPFNPPPAPPSQPYGAPPAAPYYPGATRPRLAIVHCSRELSYLFIVTTVSPFIFAAHPSQAPYGAPPSGPPPG